jgi:hypothetical protein
MFENTFSLYALQRKQTITNKKEEERNEKYSRSKLSYVCNFMTKIK